MFNSPDKKQLLQNNNKGFLSSDQKASKNLLVKPFGFEWLGFFQIQKKIVSSSSYQLHFYFKYFKLSFHFLVVFFGFKYRKVDRKFSYFIL